METYGTADKVIMKLACGPVRENQDGLKDTTFNGVTRQFCNKDIVMNGQYGKPEDNTFALATPSAKLEFNLGNPSADIFRPGKLYKVTIEPWVE